MAKQVHRILNKNDVILGLNLFDLVLVLFLFLLCLYAQVSFFFSALFLFAFVLCLMILRHMVGSRAFRSIISFCVFFLAMKKK